MSTRRKTRGGWSSIPLGLKVHPLVYLPSCQDPVGAGDRRKWHSACGARLVQAQLTAADWGEGGPPRPLRRRHRRGDSGLRRPVPRALGSARLLQPLDQRCQSLLLLTTAATGGIICRGCRAPRRRRALRSETAPTMAPPDQPNGQHVRRRLPALTPVEENHHGTL